MRDTFVQSILTLNSVTQVFHIFFSLKYWTISCVLWTLSGFCCVILYAGCFPALVICLTQVFSIEIQYTALGNPVQIVWMCVFACVCLCLSLHLCLSYTPSLLSLLISSTLLANSSHVGLLEYSAVFLACFGLDVLSFCWKCCSLESLPCQ